MDLSSLVEAIAANLMVSMGLLAAGALAGGILGVLGTLKFGRDHKTRIKALEDKSSQSPVIVNVNMAGIRGAGGNAASELHRLRQLEPQIEAHTQGEEFSYDDIWPLHYALGALGVAWPGPGVPPEFRRTISAELLAASQQGDMERARAAWRTTVGTA